MSENVLAMFVSSVVDSALRTSGCGCGRPDDSGLDELSQ
jgi:hypothetical protein